MIIKVLERFFDNFFAVEEQFRVNRKIFLVALILFISVALLINVAKKTKFLKHSYDTIQEDKIQMDEEFKKEMKERQADEYAMLEVKRQRMHKKFERPSAKKYARRQRKTRENRKEK